MNDKEYLKYELETAEREHDWTYKISVKFNGSKHSSRNLNLTREQYFKIKEILTE